MYLVYVLRNRLNDKYYVGQTIQTIHERMRDHRINKKSLIGRALRKYGEPNFEKTLFECVSRKHQDFLETYLIERLYSRAPNGYNLESGGHKNKYSHPTTKKKISEANVARGWIGEKNPFWGKHHSDEANQKNRIAHLGKPSAMKGKQQSEEAKQKMSIAKKGLLSPMKGKHHTDEAKEKNRLAHLGNEPPNKGIRQERKCPICQQSVKQLYSKDGKFKKYSNTCGNQKCIDQINILSLQKATSHAAIVNRSRVYKSISHTSPQSQ